MRSAYECPVPSAKRGFQRGAAAKLSENHVRTETVDIVSDSFGSIVARDFTCKSGAIKGTIDCCYKCIDALSAHDRRIAMELGLVVMRCLGRLTKMAAFAKFPLRRESFFVRSPDVDGWEYRGRAQFSVSSPTSRAPIVFTVRYRRKFDSPGTVTAAANVTFESEPRDSISARFPPFRARRSTCF